MFSSLLRIWNGKTLVFVLVANEFWIRSMELKMETGRYLYVFIRFYWTFRALFRLVSHYVRSLYAFSNDYSLSVPPSTSKLIGLYKRLVPPSTWRMIWDIILWLYIFWLKILPYSVLCPFNSSLDQDLEPSRRARETKKSRHDSLLLHDCVCHY